MNNKAAYPLIKIAALLLFIAVLTSCSNAKPPMPAPMPPQASPQSSASPSPGESKPPASRANPVENIDILMREVTVDGVPVTLPFTIDEIGENYQIADTRDGSKDIGKIFEFEFFGGAIYKRDQKLLDALLYGNIEQSEKSRIFEVFESLNNENSFDLKVSGIGIGSTREEVESKLGKPFQSNEGISYLYRKSDIDVPFIYISFRGQEPENDAGNKVVEIAISNYSPEIYQEIEKNKALAK